MKKGMSVAFVIGLAITMLSSLGMAVQAGTGSASMPKKRASASNLLPASPEAAAGHEIQSTRRFFISIPFGIESPLFLGDGGLSVRVAGHGGCTAGEEVTVVVTVTQTSTASVATGQARHQCNGENQSWSTRAVPDPSAAFVAEPAQACGYAVTHDGDTPTDSFEWCRQVSPTFGNFMPLVVDASVDSQ